MATNKLTEVAGLVAQAVMGAKVKDKDGNAKTVKPTGDDNLLDLTDIVAGGSTGGGNTGGDNSDHPSSGADYYAGSLADGEITGRYLLYQRDESVAEDPTTSKTVTLLRDVGTKFNMAGDGATFLLHLQKTVMTAGAKGAVSDVNLNYDTNNVAKEGYFTTTSVYPVYIKSADLATTNELDIPIDGIGENLQGGKNFLAPHLKVKFNGDGTMTYYSVTGYDNDGNSAGVTGANYDVVVDVIATFSVQDAVPQLPSTVNLFSGSAVGNVLLSGPSTNYDNIQDGLLITLSSITSEIVDGDIGGNYGLSNQVDDLRIDLSPSGLKTIKIPKEKLVVNSSIDISDQLSQYIDKMIQLQYKDTFNNWSNVDSKYSFGIVSFGGTTINVLPNTTLSMNLTVSVTGIVKDKFPIPVIQVNTYKN
jgi:hypothetical protein